MSDDPMLIKATRTEDELKRGARQVEDGVWHTAHADTMLRAALLIQQMRVRLQGENSTECDDG